ncbi:Methyltransferase domain-containing protein [Prosthecobacter debontii]|uniref:Methyltransferase domain-containing protein n=1 Tax=Prosthecobacter debontii TaxID=48467 RepID=A0A1T4YJY5_9BACT|nr:class I SAM-dependent methyltransferase [Prosthecobacter debontii]SKB02167.1 Methyltransferase domain-containing protein [Prosthecobacter debontii]
MPPPYSILTDESPVLNRRESHLLRSFDELLHDFIIRGGPQPPEYSVLNRAIRHLGDSVRGGSLSQEEVSLYIQEVTEKHLQGTMQAEALAQKYGYSGDFEIIDHIYTRKTHSDPSLRLWDLYFHSQAAPVAVRNRKGYFQDLLQKHLEQHSGPEPLQVLNVASGPSRDVHEFYLNHPQANLQMDCVDMDAHAIAYAQRLCAPWTERLRFHHRNVLRFVPTRGYHLTWSAGLFDYLSDRLFIHVLKAMMSVTQPGGEVVVGNFSDFNPSRDYMELLGRWQLVHRSQETLLALAERAGAAPDQTEVQWEAEGVNYFLHIRC